MSFLSSLAFFNPVLVLQGVIFFGAVILLYLLLFTLKDIFLRTHSFWYQAFCVLLVGALPIVGFLVYLLIRPARTIKERELEQMLKNLMGVGIDTAEQPLEEIPPSE